LLCDDSQETVTTGDDHCPEMQRRGSAERSGGNELYSHLLAE
jgi:hypothetical protein